MATHSQMTVEQYLHTAFPERDCEFVDGEIVERPMPPFEHGAIVMRLILLFAPWIRERGWWPVPEVRQQVSASRVRIPDVAVFVTRPEGNPPAEPPLIAIEVLSPDDRMSALLEKLREYREWGVGSIWVIDPMTRVLFEMTTTGLREVAAYEIPVYDLRIAPDDLFAGL
jgi:Uma2 family endonuclease